MDIPDVYSRYLWRNYLPIRRLKNFVKFYSLHKEGFGEFIAPYNMDEFSGINGNI
eukprot:UN03179